MFVLCVTEGVFWLYPVYGTLTPPQAAEKANLQDYVLNNLAGLKHSDYKDRYMLHASEHHRIGRSLHKQLAAGFKESLKLHSPQTHNGDNSHKQELGLTCLLEVVLLILCMLQSKKSPSKPGGKGSLKIPIQFLRLTNFSQGT